MAELVLSLRDRELSRTRISHSRLLMGRDASCDVVIDNAGVSRNHAILVYLDDQFRVRDNDSQNGITVNGKPVKDCVVEYGDVIGIGKFELRLLETFDEFEIEAGQKQKSAAPRSVMGTMQMSASAVAGLRDEIAAKTAARRSEQSNGSAGKARKPAADKAGKPAADKPVGARAAKPTPRPAQKERAPAPARKPEISDAPALPTNPMLKPIAIGVAVVVVLGAAAMMLL